MPFINKLKGYFLPKEIDFFGRLKDQCKITEDIVNELFDTYILESKDIDTLHRHIANAKKMRTINLIELNRVLITPVDKEAISRVYINLHWIVLSVKHLDVEISAYQIKSLKEYESILRSLKNQMHQMTASFELLKNKNYDEVLITLDGIIHLDNLLIKEYATLLSDLFSRDSIKYIMQHKEILSQLKEVSKRIHFCANSIEDIVFKIN